MLTVEALAGPEAFSSLRAEWQALDQTLSPRTPFTSPLWNELWWEHYRKSSLVARDEFLVCTVRDIDRNLIAVAPLVRSNHPAFGPLRVQQIQFFGADPNMTELRGMICRPDNQAAALNSLSRFLNSSERGWNWIRWQGIRHDDRPPARPCDDDKRFTWTRQVADYVLDLPATWAEFEKALTSRVRKKLRSCYKELQRDGHQFELRIVREPSNVPRALNDFYALHEERTKVRSYDVFADRRAKSFLDTYCMEMAQRDQLRIFEISINSLTVASRIGFLFGQDLYLYHSGNAVKWDEYSIMTMLLGEIIKWAIEHDCKFLNLSTGTDRSKTRWKPREILFTDGVEIAPGFVSLFLFSSFEFLRHRIADQSRSAEKKAGSWENSPQEPDPHPAGDAGEAG